MPGDDRIVNQTEIRFVGLQRSGNHAVINWMLSQCPGKVYFLNFVRPRTNPFETAVQNRLPKFSSAVDLVQEQQSPSQKDYLLYSYEDDDLREVCDAEFEKHHDRYLGKSLHRFDVLLLRDPYNFFASRLHLTQMGDPVRGRRGKIPLTNTTNIQALVRLWKMYAREYLGETNYFLKYNRICVNFNQWFVDEAYRRQIAEDLAIPFTDAGLDECAAYSTFEGTLDGQAGARGLRVLDRWRQFAGDSVFEGILGDAELQELSKRIFGDVTKER